MDNGVFSIPIGKMWISRKKRREMDLKRHLELLDEGSQCKNEAYKTICAISDRGIILAKFVSQKINKKNKRDSEILIDEIISINRVILNFVHDEIDEEFDNRELQQCFYSYNGVIQKMNIILQKDTNKPKYFKGKDYIGLITKNVDDLQTIKTEISINGISIK